MGDILAWLSTFVWGTFAPESAAAADDDALVWGT
jgi:hypothetical protein